MAEENTTPTVEESTDEVKETSKETTESTEETKVETDDSKDIDYYKTENKKLQDKMAGDAYKYRQNKREEIETTEETSAPQGATLEEIRKLVQEENAKTTMSIRKETIEARAKTMAKTPEEATLALNHLEHTLKGGSGNIDEDLANAFALANKGRYQAEASEAKRALSNSKRVGTGDVQSQKTAQKKQPPAVSKADAEMIKRYKLTYYEKEDRWINPHEAKVLGVK